MSQTTRMPVLFVGHGSPMNAVEDNQYTKIWQELGKKLPRPKGILAVSAHWYTKGVRLSDQTEPETIYDMYGFPRELYEIKYPAKGMPELAQEVRKILKNQPVIDNSWGIDHGVWSILHKMYPEADVPVLMMSVDMNRSAREHLQFGEELAKLRDEGIMIFASGNVVHNLMKVDFSNEQGYGWAVEFDHKIRDSIVKRDFGSVLEYQTFDHASSAFTTPDHFYPLLYALGASNEDDTLEILNDSCVYGALSMTSYLFQA